jgi:protein kinase
MDKYQFLETIGDGSYGLVHRAREQATGELVAIKQLRRAFGDWQECLALQEVKSLQAVDHPNVIRLRTVVKVAQTLYLVFEYAEGNLLQLLARRRPSELEARRLLLELLLGLRAVHAQGYFHRDLKPENILLRKGCLKVADFGLARLIRSRPPYTEYISTRWYRAPEQIRGRGHYGPPIDLFAVGCIFYELCTGLPLFPGHDDQDQLSKITKAARAPLRLSMLCTDGNRLLNALLAFDPARRPTVFQAL